MYFRFSQFSDNKDDVEMKMVLKRPKGKRIL